MTSSSTLNKGDLDLDALHNFIVQKARQCVHPPQGQLQREFVTPTYGITSGSDDQAPFSERSTVGHYLQMYDWDACFFSQAAHLIDRPTLPASVLANFLALASGDGYVPRTVSPARIWDDGDLCKPFLCQLALRIYKQAKQAALVEGASAPQNSQSTISDLLASLSSLACYLRYFKAQRQHSSGLYHWRNVLESGVDNNLALIAPTEAAKGANEAIGEFPDGRLLAVDLSSYLVAEYAAFSELCRALNKDAWASEFDKESKELAALVEKHMWDEATGLYYNVDPDNMSLVKVRAWTGFTPVLFGFARDERATKLVEQNMLNPKEFLSKYGVVSLSNSELLQNQSPRGLYGRVIVCNWQGPVWVLPNVLCARALVKMGRPDDAKKLARGVLSAMQQDIKQNNMLHENYNCDTGAGLWAPQFMSWNVLALELVNLLR